MSIFRKIAKKMAKELAESEDQRVFQILKDMECKYCGKMMISDEYDYCCDDALVDRIVEM